MINHIIKFFFNISVESKLKKIWLDKAKEILIIESSNIFRNLLLLQIGLFLFCLSIFNLIQFSSSIIQNGFVDSYIPLMNATGLMLLTLWIYVVIVKYIKSLKQQVENIKINMISSNPFVPLMNQMLKEKELFLQSSQPPNSH